MKCPDCWFIIESLPCPHCAEREEKQDNYIRHLASEFSLARGIPTNEEEIKSLREAERRIKSRDIRKGIKALEHIKI